MSELRPIIKSSVIILTILLFLNSCGLFKKNNPVSPSDKIEYGNFVKISTQNIGTNGGKITYTSTDSLNGLSIEVPNAGLKDSKTFDISTAPIKKINFGSDFLPLSPIIRISNGGGYSDSIMTVEIPIKLPDGYFPMAFYYDSETGELEGIPAGAVTSQEIYIGTRHFDGKKLSDGKTTKISATQNFADIIVAAVKLDQLNGVYDSGFKPGEDDWEFPNKGPYITPGGMCSGKCLSEMWYYSVRKLKEHKSKIYGTYDQVGYNTPDEMWQDNPKGIRLAGMVQYAYKQNDTNGRRENWRTKFEQVGLKKFTKDSLDYFSFLYGIKIIGKPQMVSIRNTNKNIGHAMVVYKAGNGLLNVADPNYPANPDRTITFTNGTFDPYNSGSDDEHLGVPFNSIMYVAKSAYVDFAQVEQLWKEFDNNTIGNGTFPDIQLQYKDTKNNWVTLPDVLETKEDSIIVRAVCPTCFQSYPDNETALYILDEKGTALNNFDASNTLVPKVALYSKDIANQKLGLYTAGWPNGNNTSRYINFQWFTLSGKLSLTIESAESGGAPINTAGVVNKQYKFFCKNIGIKPSKYKYSWDFGDGNTIDMQNDSTVYHTYSKEGSFKISAKLFDLTTGISVAETNSPVQIGQINNNPVITGIMPKSYIIYDQTSGKSISMAIYGSNLGNKTSKPEINIGGKKMNIDYYDSTYFSTLGGLILEGSLNLGLNDVFVTVNGVKSNVVQFYHGLPNDTIKKRLHKAFENVVMECKTTNTKATHMEYSVDCQYNANYVPSMPNLSWNGDSFSMDYSGSCNGLGLSYKISGTISSDGMNITNIIYDGTYQVAGTNENNSIHIEISQINAYNVIWDSGHNDPPVYYFTANSFSSGIDDLTANITKISGQLFFAEESKFYDIISYYPKIGSSFRLDFKP